jgi:hypothetical protein
MNILKQLNQSGWPMGTCSDLVEWVINTPFELYSPNNRLLLSDLGVLRLANTELRKPLSIEDFTGEDAIFESWANSGWRETFRDLNKGLDVIRFINNSNVFLIKTDGPYNQGGVWDIVCRLKTPSRNQFIDACNRIGIDLNTPKSTDLKPETKG